MICDIKIHPPTPLMPLHQPMPPERKPPRLDVLELAWRRPLAAPPQTVRGNVVLPAQLRLQPLLVRVKVLKRFARVRELGVAARAAWGQRVRTQQAEAGAAWVEGRVDVEERVALAEVVAPRVGLGDGAVVFEVRDVEELVVREAVFAAEREVGFYLCGCGQGGEM